MLLYGVYFSKLAGLQTATLLLPTEQSLLLKPIIRHDDGKANLTIRSVNKHLTVWLNGFLAKWSSLLLRTKWLWVGITLLSQKGIR